MKPEGSYFIIRPRFEDIQVAGAGVYGCSCGACLWTVSELKEHWQLGHYDRIINPGDEGYNNLLAKAEGVE